MHDRIEVLKEDLHVLDLISCALQHKIIEGMSLHVCADGSGSVRSDGTRSEKEFDFRLYATLVTPPTDICCTIRQTRKLISFCVL